MSDRTERVTPVPSRPDVLTYDGWQDRRITLATALSVIALALWVACAVAEVVVRRAPAPPVAPPITLTCPASPACPSAPACPLCPTCPAPAERRR